MVIQAPDAVHVFSVAMFEDIITEALKPSDVDDIDSWMPLVIKDWIEGLRDTNQF